MKRSEIVIAVFLAAMFVTGCSSKRQGVFQGYIEGEFVYVASPLGGTLTNLAVARGAEVKSGQLLFELEREAESAAVREASQKLLQAQAQLENLKKGKRPSEIASLDAQLDRARANLRLSEIELTRVARLREEKVVAADELDRVKARRDADQAQVESLAADLDTARLGARDDEIKAAEAEVQAFTAALARAEWSLTQKKQMAPANARVHDTLYRVGEWVSPGNPVVSLLPPTNIKVRFFVPQAELPGIKIGQGVSVTFDGGANPYRATVNYISTQAEFTPPVIYSQNNRAKLVFMVEAVFSPADADRLRVGQPVDVTLEESVK
ncbi:MAG TPA: HlyD family efflux transporter periplasmic adaptor subunit [Verrucomicrobiae bacterium]|nr:HlyD family efflux transporter periplasmic adaptor subunit [Verrucomicrobiae bacterium]